jgi:hypothetical protein
VCTKCDFFFISPHVKLSHNLANLHFSFFFVVVKCRTNIIHQFLFQVNFFFKFYNKQKLLYFIIRSEPRSTTPVVAPPTEDVVVYPDSPDSSIYGSEDEEQEDISQYRRGGYRKFSSL